MDRSDFNEFAGMWSAAYELCRGKTASPGGINMAFEVLRGYPLEHVSRALTKHCRTGEGKFGLTTGHVCEIIDGPKPTADDVIAAAIRPQTPLGVLCAIEIGSSNLSELHPARLKILAKVCLNHLDDWRERIRAGSLETHELEAMRRRGIDPSSTLRLSAPAKGLALTHQGAEP